MADEVLTPATDNQDSASGADAPVVSVPGDGYGSSTVAFGTPILAVVPPRGGYHARVEGLIYKCGTTAHTGTMMVCLDQCSVATRAATGQAVVVVDALPSSDTSGVAAASDFIVLKDDNGVYQAYKIASISTLSITVTVSVGGADGSGFTTKIPEGRTVWFFGAPGDHPLRQFAFPASTTWPLYPSQAGWCTSPKRAQPILVHVDNATATGTLTGPTYSHVKL